MATTLATIAPPPTIAIEPPGPSPRGGWLLPRWLGNYAWVETIVITLAAIALGWLADPTDPLHVRSQFPWLWFAPVLVALRYGVVFGITSAAILIAAWYALTPGSLAAELPKFHILGGLLLTLICAEFGSAWRLRLRRASELNAYYDDRVERVTRQLYLLRLSHDRLEQELMSRPTTMRDALAQLRAQLRGLRGDRARARLPGAPEVLQFLAQHCQLEQAAIYAIDNAAPSADGVPTFTRTAVLGTPPALQPDDPLLAYVLDSGELAHVQVEGLTESLPTQQIVVCPIQTSDKRLLGVLAVNRIPFFALNTEQLQLMRVLTGAYADGVVMTPALLAIQRALPDAPEDFADELARAERIQREFAISSHIVVMLFGDVPLAQDAFQLVLRQRRAPDVVWTPTRAEHKAVFVNLLPVSGTAAVEGYLVRTENAIRENFATDLQTLRVRSFTISLADPDPAAALARVLATGVR